MLLSCLQQQFFYDFQYEFEIGCFNCGVEEMKSNNEIYIFKLREGSRRRAFDVVFDPTTLDTKCFCKKFERLINRNALKL